MLVKEEILYIKLGNRESIIYTLNGIVHINKTIDNLFNEWCLEELTTYKGRMEALRIKYRFKKLVPVYINKKITLFPLFDKKDLNNVYINYINVLFVEKQGQNTIIEFINHEQLIVEKNYQIINKYYKRCEKIYYSI